MHTTAENKFLCYIYLTYDRKIKKWIFKTKINIVTFINYNKNWFFETSTTLVQNAAYSATWFWICTLITTHITHWFETIKHNLISVVAIFTSMKFYNNAT